jgi:protein SCO1/2
VAAEPVAAGTAADQTVAIYLMISSEGDGADTLTAVESPLATKAIVHGEMTHDGMAMMMPLASVPVPAHGVVRLGPGKMHVMLEGLTRRIAAGDTLPLVMVFRHAGRLEVRAPVVRFADLDRSVSAAPRSSGPVPALRLARSDGAVFDLTEQRGRVVVVFFGYTHCPDLCPLTLANFAWVRRRLASRAAQVRFVFVTVDPGRDSPARAMAYARQFDSSFVGLSGDSATLAATQRAFHVASWVSRDSAGTVLVAHSASVFVVGRDGALARVLSHDEADVDRLYAAVSEALES